MRRLATDVGLSKSALFHYFSTKHELYEEVLERVLERLESALETGRKTLGGPVERLEVWIDSLHLALAEDIPSARLLMRMMLKEEPFSGFLLEPRAGRSMLASERLARILGRLGALLEEGVATGVFRPLSIGDAVQTTIGASVFHFASGDLGQALLGESSPEAAAAERRRREVSDFIRRGLLA
jgi:AcrR family transcriptional regulator